MNNKAMLIGAIDAGKTTLINALLGNTELALKTQTLHYHQWIVDTPGEYTENPLFYKNIMATALEVSHVLYVQDASSNKSIFPPSFGSGIPKLPIAIVTKSDAPGADVGRAIQILKRVVGVGPVVITSVHKDEGLQYIKPLVCCDSLEEMKAYVDTQDNSSLQFIGK